MSGYEYPLYDEHGFRSGPEYFGDTPQYFFSTENADPRQLHYIDEMMMMDDLAGRPRPTRRQQYSEAQLAAYRAHTDNLSKVHRAAEDEGIRSFLTQFGLDRGKVECKASLSKRYWDDLEAWCNSISFAPKDKSILPTYTVYRTEYDDDGRPKGGVQKHVQETILEAHRGSLDQPWHVRRLIPRTRFRSWRWVSDRKLNQILKAMS